jgi:hypothetical protein
MGVASVRFTSPPTSSRMKAGITARLPGGTMLTPRGRDQVTRAADRRGAGAAHG